LLASKVNTSPSGEVVLDALRELGGQLVGTTQAHKDEFAQNALGMIMADWGGVQSNFELLNREIQTQGESESKVRDVLASTISSLQSVLHDSDSKIQLLVSRIDGSRDASDKGSLTCWDAIKQLQEGVEAIKRGLPVTAQLLDKLRETGDGRRETGDGVEARLVTLGKSFDNMTGHYRTTITNVNDQLGRLSWRSAETTTGYAALGMQFGSVQGDVATNMVALQQRVKELENGRRLAGRNPNRHEAAAFESIKQYVRELERWYEHRNAGGGGQEHLEWAMTVIQEKMKEMEGRVTDAPFRLNQYTFSTSYKVKTWCEDNKNVITYVTFWDLFSVFVAMKPRYQTGKDMADERYSSVRIKLTPFENDLAASMLYPMPLALFGKRGGELALMNEGFGACTSYEQWVGSGCDSVKAMLTTQLVNFCSGVNGTLDYSHPATPFITALLTEVQSGLTHRGAIAMEPHGELYRDLPQWFAVCGQVHLTQGMTTTGSYHGCSFWGHIWAEDRGSQAARRARLEQQGEVDLGSAAVPPNHETVHRCQVSWPSGHRQGNGALYGQWFALCKPG
jgi:hypothetical protein